MHWEAVATPSIQYNTVRPNDDIDVGPRISIAVRSLVHFVVVCGSMSYLILSGPELYPRQGGPAPTQIIRNYDTY